MKLLNAVDANTVGTGQTFAAGRRARQEATRTVFCFGDDFDGGTVTLELSPDNETTWIAARDAETGAAATFAVSSIRSVRMNGTHARARLAGGGTSISNVTLEVH